MDAMDTEEMTEGHSSTVYMDEEVAQLDLVPRRELFPHSIKNYEDETVFLPKDYKLIEKIGIGMNYSVKIHLIWH